MRALFAAVAASLLLVPAAAAKETYSVVVHRGVAGITLGTTYSSLNGRLGVLIQSRRPLLHQACGTYTKHRWLELCFNTRGRQPVESFAALQPLDELGSTPRYCLAGMSYCLGDRDGVKVLKRRYGASLRGPIRLRDGANAYILSGPWNRRRVETAFLVPGAGSRWAGQGRVYAAYISVCGRQDPLVPPCAAR